MKKVWHIVERIDTKYGGPAISVPNLAKHLNNDKYENFIIAGFVEKNAYELLNKHKLKRNLRQSINQKLAFVPFLYISSHLKFKRPDFIFFHNLWNFIPLVGYLYCSLFKIPYAVTPRGSLFEWSLQQGKFRKKIAFAIFQKRMLEKAKFIHVTSIEERDAVESLVSNHCVVSENGVHELNALNCEDYNELIRNRRKEKRLLYFGRIHKKKNIETLIKAFAQSRLPSTYRLSIVGGVDNDSYAKTLVALARHLKCDHQIEFFPFQQGRQKMETFNSHCVLVLPSFTENFGIVVTEALSVGMPVIASTGTPWKQLNETGAGYWIDCTTTTDILSDCLNEIMEMDEKDYIKMCKSAYELSLKYNWTTCVKPLEKSLERVLFKCDQK